MKRIFRTLSLLVGAILACAAISAPVAAQALTDNYKFSNGNTLNISHVRGIAKSGNNLAVLSATGNWNTTDYPDAAGTVYSAITSRSDFPNRFVTWSVSGLIGAFMQASVADSTRCSGTNTVVLWTWAGTDSFADGCVLNGAVKAKTP